MSAFATGKHAIAICDRCGQQYKFQRLKKEWNGLYVCPECYEPKHPQLDPPHHNADAQALPWSRPAREEPMTVFVGAPGDSAFTSTGMQPSNEIRDLNPALLINSVNIIADDTDVIATATGLVSSSGIGQATGVGDTVYTVTVGSKGGGGNAFYIDGVERPTLSLTEGDTYVFNLDSGTVPSHPFYLSTTDDGNHNGGSPYSTGVIYRINGSDVSESDYTSNYASASSRELQITVAIGAPTLYYYCSVHSGMGNIIST